MTPLKIILSVTCGEACGPFGQPIRVRPNPLKIMSTVMKNLAVCAAFFGIESFRFRCNCGLFGQKSVFSGDFQRPNLTMRENLGAKSFQQALIPNGLKIICKVSRENLHPLVEGVGA
jgi:hypothetical protein